LKIVSWNCNGAFRRKFSRLSSIDADILIIQECENPALSKNSEYKSWAKNYLWIGSNKNSGLGVFVKENVALTKLDWPSDTFELFLPFCINQNTTFLAVWTKQANSPTFQYIGQFWKYLQLNRKLIEQTQPIICGDFNSNKIWDKWDRWWNHSDVVRELAELNILSLYHSLHSTNQGQEEIATFYLHRKLEKPYHIDYAFLPKNILSNASMQVGEVQEWLTLSDHMPLIINTAQ
jgi:exonuclease III